MTAPEPGWTTEVKYLRSLDGDTIEVSIERKFKIRLKDIDVYEKKTTIGQLAKDFIHNKLTSSNEIIVFVPTNDPLKLMDMNSFERIVAQVYIDGVDLAVLLRDNGFEKCPEN